MVSVPPSGMASRALTARLSRASSIWLGSAEAGGRPAGRSKVDFDGRADRAAQQISHAAHQLGEIGRPRLSAWRRAKASRRCVSGGAALGALRGAVDQAFRDGIVRQPLAQKLEIAQHRGQQVVEVVRHAAGELADRFQLLQLAQLVLGAVALGDLRKQLVMGMLELGGALLDPALELVVHLLQAQLALAQILEQRARLVLAATAPYGRARHAHQRGGMERPLDERHVAQGVEPARGDGIALRPAAVIGHQDEGQIGPCRLARQPLRRAA